MSDHVFGGRHTDEKLDQLQQYLRAFSTALKSKGFARVYIDAFAGSGDRSQVLPALPLLHGNQAESEVLTTPGSARLALEVEPPFDVLVFIEKDRSRLEKLKSIASEYPARKVKCADGDANEIVSHLCHNLPWRGSNNMPGGMRGVIFLDPYGMEVHWETVEAIARTEALDLWYFFPLMGLYRQAANDPAKIDEDKRQRLNAVLGSDDWLDLWYGKPSGQQSFFDDPAEIVRIADVNAIEADVTRRLKAVFKGTVLPPRRIYNERNAPLASLFFAVSNPNRNAIDLAKRIAGHILASGNASQVRPR